MKKLNNMCLNCINKECSGTSSTVWTGCIYKQPGSKEAAANIRKQFTDQEADGREKKAY